MREPSNYPPGVTGNEWQIAGPPDDECCSRCGVPGEEHEELEDCADALIEYYGDEDNEAA